MNIGECEEKKCKLDFLCISFMCTQWTLVRLVIMVFCRFFSKAIAFCCDCPASGNLKQFGKYQININIKKYSAKNNLENAKNFPRNMQCFANKWLGEINDSLVQICKYLCTYAKKRFDLRKTIFLIQYSQVSNKLVDSIIVFRHFLCNKRKSNLLNLLHKNQGNSILIIVY